MSKMTDKIFWKAVKENDRRFDGVFYTCVLTTKIFCRPSCPARTPKRENVIFVSDKVTAEKKGFRACLRCRPNVDSNADPKAATAVRACKLIES
ncbi:MAG: hypothetical protein OEQ28_14645, partial [Acidobacteriota bacterium]|nr:hypothetical protein [Acidobacteriota bacterium]